MDWNRTGHVAFCLVRSYRFLAGALFAGALFAGALFAGALFAGALFAGALFAGALFAFGAGGFWLSTLPAKVLTVFDERSLARAPAAAFATFGLVPSLGKSP